MLMDWFVILVHGVSGMLRIHMCIWRIEEKERSKTEDVAKYIRGWKMNDV